MMQSRSRSKKSTLTSGKLLESAASAGAHKPLVRQESKRRRECRARTFPADRKVARHGNRFVVVAASVPLHAREDHPVCQRQSIRWDILLRRLGRVRSFVDRNKMCT